MSIEPVSAARLKRHIGHLCLDIGVRLAGTAGEAAAASYAAEHFRSAGAAVSVETFPVKSRRVEEERLEILIDGAWRPFPCSLFSSTPGTGGAPIEAPLVFFEAPAAHGSTDLADLRGKAVVHLGCHIESREAYRRLIAAKPAFFLFVDVRYPGTTPLADGMFPAYTRDLGAVPVVNVAYQDAWQWSVRGAKAARLIVAGGMVDGTSQNVMADLPASTPTTDVVYFGAHHDTQADSVGADDNATGVAGLLELASVLAPLRRKRTIRLVSFGAEEQLSVGSAQYVRAHREAVQDCGKLIFNLDSYGSYMGWNELVVNGPPELESFMGDAFAKRGLTVKIDASIMPYADHFPFVAAGIPGLTLIRPNCTGGRFFHHRGDDDPSRVSPVVMARLLDAVAAAVAELATCATLPFSASIPERQAKDVEKFWTDLFGGWESPPPRRTRKTWTK